MTTTTEFQRFTAPDAAQLERDIATARLRFAQAEALGDDAALVEHATDLGSLLTTARREAEALAVLEPQRSRAEGLAGREAAAWYWNALATALQYLGRREEAEPLFDKAVQQCRRGGWQALQAMVQHHWGRSLVEQGRLDEARRQLAAALAIRQALGHPRLASTQRALEALAELPSRAWRA